jgi:RimJ/RimL family protein N-acetyltransferase
MTDVEFVPYDERFLEHSWNWLNDPEIKELTRTPDFDREGQRKWFESLGTKKDYLIYGVCYRSVPVGACGLKNITPSSAEYWGYIGKKEYWGCGIGKNIVESMVSVAKDNHIERVWLKVSNKNFRAVALYSKFGFSHEADEDGISIMALNL